MGYVGHGGIWGLLNKYGITCDKLIDREAGVWNDINANGTFDKGEVKWSNADEIEWINAGTTSGTGEKWIVWVTDPNSDIYSKREAAVLGSTDQINLGGGVKVTVVQVNAEGVKMKDGENYTVNDTPYKSYSDSAKKNRGLLGISWL